MLFFPSPLSAPLFKWAAPGYPLTLCHGNDRVRHGRGYPLDEAVRPRHLDHLRLPGAQTEVQPKIVLGDVTSSAADFVGLSRSVSGQLHRRTDRIAVQAGSDELHNNGIAG